jgi:plastocyanin
MTKRVIGTGAAIACAALVLPALALGRPSAAAVAVTAGKPAEPRFTLSKRTVPRGAVTFTVTNRGRLPHDFAITGKKTRRLSAGKRATLTVTFRRAGRFPFVCTVPGHAAGGMKGTLVVR